MKMSMIYKMFIMLKKHKKNYQHLKENTMNSISNRIKMKIKNNKVNKHQMNKKFKKFKKKLTRKSGFTKISRINVMKCLIN